VDSPSALAAGGTAAGADTAGASGVAPEASDAAVLASPGRTVAGAGTAGPSVSSLYIIVIIAAIVALAGTQVLRLLAVRLAWTS
jgi:hypothetical protein